MFSPQKLAQGLMQNSNQPLNMVRGTGFQAPQTISYGPSSYTPPSEPVNTGLFGKIQYLMSGLQAPTYSNVNDLIPNYDENGLQYKDKVSQAYYNQVKRPLYLAGPTDNAAINDISHQLSQAGTMGQLLNSIYSAKLSNDTSNPWSRGMWQVFIDNMPKEEF